MKIHGTQVWVTVTGSKCDFGNVKLNKHQPLRLMRKTCSRCLTKGHEILRGGGDFKSKSGTLAVFVEWFNRNRNKESQTYFVLIMKVRNINQRTS